MDPKPVTENRFLPHWFDEDVKTKISAFEPHFDLYRVIGSNSSMAITNVSYISHFIVYHIGVAS